MKLYYSHTSPYSRKVRLLIYEKGLHDQVMQILCNPFDDTAELKAANPLGKIPTLIMDNGEALFDSPVICEYLDCLGTNSRLVPESGQERWQTLRWEALADGMTDAAYNMVMEKRRPEQEQSNKWATLWSEEILRSLHHIEHNLPTLPDQITLAQLALAAAIGYLEFRLPELLTASECVLAKSWYAHFKDRESMMETRPVETT